MRKLKKGDITGRAFADSTVRAVGKRLRHLSKYAGLNNPDQVKDFIASKTCGNGFKESLAEAYDYYVKAHGLSWVKPFYERYDKLPKIPSEVRQCGYMTSATSSSITYSAKPQKQENL